MWNLVMQPLHLVTRWIFGNLGHRFLLLPSAVRCWQGMKSRSLIRADAALLIRTETS